MIRASFEGPSFARAFVRASELDGGTMDKYEARTVRHGTTGFASMAQAKRWAKAASSSGRRVEIFNVRTGKLVAVYFDGKALPCE